MPGTYTNLALDVILELGGEMGDEFSEFQRKDKGNLSVLRCFSDNTKELYSVAAMRKALDERTSPAQQVFIDVIENEAPQTGTQAKRIGTGGANRKEVELVPQTLIEEGFSVSRVNEMLARFNSYSTEVRVAKTMQFCFAQAFQNILLRLDTLCTNYLDDNKSTGGGAGTIFPATANLKQIPATEDEKLFLKIETEAMQNKYGVFFDIVGSSYTHYLKRLTEAYGQYNQINTAPSTQNHRFYISNRIEPADPLTDEALFYLISRGGVGAMSHCYKLTDDNTIVRMGNDTWFVAAIPPMPMFEGIDTDQFHVLIKGYEGWVDNFETYANDMSRVDIVQAVSITMIPYLYSAYSPNAGRTPIIGYSVLKPE